MLKTFALAAALAVPGSAQSLLDHLVTYAAEEGRTLLVPGDVADELEGSSPATDARTLDRRSLEACLAQTNARMTHVGNFGVVLYGKGSEVETMLLEVHGPFVEPEQLAQHADDLVWTLAPLQVEPATSELSGVLEAVVGDHRVLGGAARTLRAALGEPGEGLPAIELLPIDAEPREDGPTLREWLSDVERETGLVFTYDEDVQLDLREVRVWSDRAPLEVLRTIGFLAQHAGPPDAEFVEVRTWRFVPPRTNTHTQSYFIEDPSELAGLEGHTQVTMVRLMANRSARPLASVLQTLDKRCQILGAGREELVVLSGTAVALRRWRRVLELLDHPR